MGGYFHLNYFGKRLNKYYISKALEIAYCQTRQDTCLPKDLTQDELKQFLINIYSRLFYHEIDKICIYYCNNGPM